MPKAPERPDLPRVLVVTNDFPPRIGGVQQYVWNLLRHLPADRVAVLAPNWPGWREHDAAQAYPVHRWPATALRPTGDLARRVRSLAKEYRAEVVLFTQGLPLPLIGPGLAARGLPYVVITHGYEVWMARLPGTMAALRRALSQARGVTAISAYTARYLCRALPPGMVLFMLSPGVDERRFHPAVDGSAIRALHGLDGRRVVVCVSRLIPRKGQDVLIRAMAEVARHDPDAALLIVGDGPDRARLEGLAGGAPAGSVVFAGAVDDASLPAHYAAGDIFAMPCRSRWAGLETEGFGIVFLEAAATGKAVLAGHSGGAAEAVLDQETGLVVEGREPNAVAVALRTLLGHPVVANRLGSAGRARVETDFTWTGQATRLAEILARAAT